jgi:hypothetical protein
VKRHIRSPSARLKKALTKWRFYKPMHLRTLTAVLCILLGFGSAPALANTSVGAGIFFPSDGGATGGLLGSIPLMSVPVAPVNVQLSGALPFSGGRFAVTAEGVLHEAGFFVGGGAGVGRFRQTDGTTGAVYDILGGIRLAPLLTLHARYYGSGGGNVGSATYMGLFFSLK